MQPEPEFVNLFRESTGIDSQPGGPVRQSYLTYRPARLQRVAESIPGLLKGLQSRALVLSQGRTNSHCCKKAKVACPQDCPRSDCRSPWPRPCLLCHTDMFPHLFAKTQFQLSPTAYYSYASSVPTVVLDTSFLQLKAYIYCDFSTVFSTLSLQPTACGSWFQLCTRLYVETNFIHTPK